MFGVAIGGRPIGGGGVIGIDGTLICANANRLTGVKRSEILIRRSDNTRFMMHAPIWG
jgi:hypothetical protein